VVTVEPIRVEVEREEDGRMVACVRDLPGVMAYGETWPIVLQVLADMVESGEELPEPLRVLFAA